MLALSLFAIFQGYSHSAGAQSRSLTAAETDWVVDHHSEKRAASNCSGRYVEPGAEPGARSDDTISDPAHPDSQTKNLADDKIKASARSILHVVELSTTLTDDIEISTDSQVLKSDFATIDAKTEIYKAEGDVTIRQPGMLLKGESATGNLFAGTASIDSASYLIHASRIRGSARSVSQTEGSKLVIKDGVFTTCDPESNFWSVEGETIVRHTREGYGIARNVRLVIKDVPLAYLPWFRFPIGDNRQSGFLVPSIANDSDGGLDLTVPYYFNIAPDLDATYSLRNIWKRGTMHEGELRHLNETGETLVAAAFLPSDNEFDDRSTIDLTAANPASFEEQDRWLMHLYHKSVRDRWVARLNYTGVSDTDYLRDLGGIAASEVDFDQTLGSGQSPALLRSGSVAYHSNHLTSQLELISFQNLSEFQAEQYETLPRVTVDYRNVLYRNNVSALDISSRVQFTEFRKNSSGGIDPITGQRVVLDTAIEFPMRETWGFIIPRAGLIHRQYNLSDVPAGAQDNPAITTASASIDAGLIFERATRFRDADVVQTLEPRIYYLYTNEKYQDDLPEFDTTTITPSYTQIFRPNRFTGYDRIGDANQVAAGVETHISSAKTGSNLLSASFGQIFHLQDQKVFLNPTPGYDPDADTSPLFASLKMHLSDSVSVYTSIEYDSDAGEANRGFASLKYRSPDAAVFNFSYAYTSIRVQRPGPLQNERESNISFSWPLSRKWNIVGRWAYGFDESQTIESLAGVEYNDCCWKARLVYRRSLEEPRLVSFTSPLGTTTAIDHRADSGIFFEFQLKGLGSLGGRLDSFLRDSIPGYR